MEPTTLSIADYLKYADLQMASEAFLFNEGNRQVKGDLNQALIDGNFHASRFTKVQAANFAAHWIAVDQIANTATGFSGTLFKCIQDDPTTGAKAGELVMSSQWHIGSDIKVFIEDQPLLRGGVALDVAADCLKVRTEFNDPVELAEREALALADLLIKLVEDLRK